MPFTFPLPASLRWVFLVGVLSLSMGFPKQLRAADEISFGLISTETAQNLKQEWQPLIDDLNRQTGLKVTAFFASDYAGIIEGMRFNKVQLAWLGNKSALEAVDRADGEIFAQMVTASGTHGYYSHLLVHRDSPYNNVDEMLRNARSLSFGNGDPNSTSGFLVPNYYVFAQRHVDPRTAFRVTRSAGHEANALAVANRQIDVATCNSEVMDHLQEHTPDKFRELKILWTSPLIPSDPMVWRKDLPESVKARLRSFFLNYGKTDPREKAVLMKVNKLAGFRESNDRQLLPIRELELFAQRSRLEADVAVSEADRRARLAEIDRKLAILKGQ